MANIQGTNVAAGIAPFTTEDTYATHFSEYGKGGWHEVATNEERDAIPADRRTIGMAVSITSTKKIYILYEAGWVEFAGSSADLSNYYNKQETDALLENKVDTETLDNYATKAEVPTKTSQLENDSNFLTAVPEEYITDSELNDALTLKADKATNLAGYGITDAYTKTEVDAKVASVYRFKGSVENVGALPTEGQVVGDVYNVEDTGANYAWTGSDWDKLSETVDLTSYLTKDEATATYATIANVESQLNSKADKTALNAYATTEQLAEGLALKANSADLSTVATTGSYNDLEDKPVIPEEYILKPATTEVLGGVKPDGTTIAVTEDGTISALVSGGGGTSDYNALTNKPQINGNTLTGNKTLEELGIQVAGEYVTSTELTDGLATKLDKTTVATVDTAGIVKPDGESITVKDDGTISGTLISFKNWSD